MRNILITGGAGFIGSNLAESFLAKGDKVTILDNLCRDGSKINLEWLRSKKGNLTVVEGDVRNSSDVEKCIADKDLIFHLAAQVAVTTSVTDPRPDFEINALGTFNVLEAMRKINKEATLLYTSTNKVYGEMTEMGVVEKTTRYDYKNLTGVSEQQPLDFHSPYGCSKGSADQYVRDYHRIYGLNTIVFRQSCIYGPRQFGVEDQGWVAWFLIALTQGRKLTVYGDGKQVRDILYVSDLINAYNFAVDNKKVTSGQVYNVGGGRENTISVWYEFGPILEKLFKRKIDVKFSDWRPGDQKVFISDVAKAKKDFGWEPKVSAEQGIKLLFDWIQENKNLFEL